MKRASSLNVLNVGGTVAEDHFQVRSPAPLNILYMLAGPFLITAAISSEPVNILVFLIQDK